MPNNYIAYHFSIVPKEPWEDILLAQLQGLPFESFESSKSALHAFIPEHLHFKDFLKEIPLFDNSKVTIEYEIEIIEPINWNAKWEAEYHPILIGENCVVRANFHPSMTKQYELIINPKMSFGTGHHQTTQMMLEFVLAESIEDKIILDMGCGTGVLGILACKRGASKVFAIDNDPWCVENTKENMKLNTCQNISVHLNSSIDSYNYKYDLIFANINRNILLEQIPSYSKAMNPESILLLSGFYNKDIQVLKTLCINEGLSFIGEKKNQDWCALKFKK